MTYHVHIVTVGFDPKPSLKTLCCGIPADKIYILCDPTDHKAHESMNTVTDTMKRTGVMMESISIDGYDYDKVYNKVIEISDNECNKHADCKFHINFSRGSAILVGAVCSAAYEIDCDLYYVKMKPEEKDLNIEDEIIRINIANTIEIHSLKQKTKDVLEKFRACSSISNAQLSIICGYKGNKNSLRYHTEKLMDYGFIEREQKGRTVNWLLTDKGRRGLNRIPSAI